MGLRSRWPRRFVPSCRSGHRVLLRKKKRATASPELNEREGLTVRETEAARPSTTRRQTGPRAAGSILRPARSVVDRAMPRTLFDKVWESHVVDAGPDGADLLYIDRHLIHEVTSPQAFEGLRLAGRGVRRPVATLAVADHNVPTAHRARGIDDPESRAQVETLEDNCGRARHPLLSHARRPAGHRPHRRTRAGPDPARHDHRLRRLAHLDPRGLRGAGVRHRHVGSGARTGDPDPGAAPPPDDAHHGGGGADTGSDGQGPDPRRHWPHRHRRRHRPRHRVRRPGHPRPVDGRPHDGVQHVDRGGRPRGADRSRRPDRSPTCGDGRWPPTPTTSTGRRRSGAHCRPTRAPPATARSAWTPPGSPLR